MPRKTEKSFNGGAERKYEQRRTSIKQQQQQEVNGK